MKSSRSSLFLMELIISILFFSLASAVCIQLFVKAHVLDIRTREQNQAVIWSQNLASLWQADDGDLNSVYEQLLTDFSQNEEAFILSSDASSITINFDQDFHLMSSITSTSRLGNADGNVSTEVVHYQIMLKDHPYDSENNMYNADMLFFRQEESFYSLSLTRHTPSERGSLDE